jgi:hypothetical protein
MREQLSSAAATDVWSAGGDDCAGEKGQIVEKDTALYHLGHLREAHRIMRLGGSAWWRHDPAAGTSLVAWRVWVAVLLAEDGSAVPDRDRLAGGRRLVQA